MSDSRETGYGYPVNRKRGREQQFNYIPPRAEGRRSTIILIDEDDDDDVEYVYSENNPYSDAAAPRTAKRSRTDANETADSETAQMRYKTQAFFEESERREQELIRRAREVEIKAQRSGAGPASMPIDIDEDLPELAYTSYAEQRPSSQYSSTFGSTGASTAADAQQHDDQDHILSIYRIINPDRKEGENSIVVYYELYRSLKNHYREALRFLWRNVVDNPPDLKGCIIAHSMGLGKTFLTIVFIKHYLEYKKGKHILIACPKCVLQNWHRELTYTWRDKIGTLPYGIYYIDDTVSTHKYRSEMVKNWDDKGGCFIISYGMFVNLLGDDEAASEELEKLRTLARPAFCEKTDLLIADEGHDIKNPKTYRYLAMEHVHTSNRVLLTGTPLYNHLMEFYTMINYVRKRMWTYQEFLDIFNEPIVTGSSADADQHDVDRMKKAAFNLIREIKPFIHRRDHSIREVKEYLPKKFEFVISLKMTPFQRKLYRYFVAAAKARAAKEDKSLDESYKKHLIVYTIFLLKVLNHPDMLVYYCKKKGLELLEEDDDLLDYDPYASTSASSSNHYPRYQYQHDSDITDLDEMEDEEQVEVEHASIEDDPLFYRFRIHHVPVKQKQSKGKKKKARDTSDEDEEGDQDNEEDTDASAESVIGADHSWLMPVLAPEYKAAEAKNSSKMQLLLKIIEDTFATTKDDKIIVFSAYVDCLDIIESVLANTELSIGEGPEGKDKTILRPNVHYFRMDGKTNLSTRMSMINEFNNRESQKRLFLVSTKSGGIGINLIGANRVVLFDVNWNESIDYQAIFRAYRFGYTKDVFIYRFVASLSSEETVFKICMRKHWYFLKVVDEKNPIRVLTEADFKMDNCLRDNLVQDNVELDESQFEVDDLLTNIVTDNNPTWRQLIRYIVSHESLFPENIDEELPADEREAAHEEYRDQLQRQRDRQHLNFVKNEILPPNVGQAGPAAMQQYLLQQIQAQLDPHGPQLPFEATFDPFIPAFRNASRQ